MPDLNFRATPISAETYEGEDENERRFRASVEVAFNTVDRALAEMQAEISRLKKRISDLEAAP